ncbi:hypothetical protein ACFVVA_26940 [Kitasatospora sp. NPDC058048]|uniref:hypothetical protein n=1 Tax=Kitasatospora sp. NPDC058048 TaxID=3346313 RepID=UPI0036DB9C48
MTPVVRLDPGTDLHGGASPYEGPAGLSGEDRRFAAAQTVWGAGGILASLPGRATSTISDSGHPTR